MDSDKLIIGGLVLVLVALLVFAVWASVKEEERWQEFAREHNCVEIGEMEGDVGVGVGPALGGGNNSGIAIVVTSTPGKVGYKCDDGKTYWRNK